MAEYLGETSLRRGGVDRTYPTVVPAHNFNPDEDANRIKDALHSNDVDEQTIIDVLTKRTYSQRREIAFAFERKHKKEMVSVLESALSGSLKTVILGLLKSPAQYDASEIKSSLGWFPNDDETLIEMVCSRSYDELMDIQKVNEELFKKLEKNVDELLVALLQTKRDESSSDNTSIIDARALYEAKLQLKDTDVIIILSKRSISHLQEVFEKYKSLGPFNIQESIRKEVNGKLKMSFLALVECIENKQQYFASRLQDAMKSTVNEKVLTRIIVSRCEVDLKVIRKEFKFLHGKSLYQTIGEHTEGNYKNALQSLCGEDDQPSQ